MANGVDMLDVPVRVTAESPVREVALVLTDGDAELYGMVSATAGGQVIDRYVLLFAAERTLWTFPFRRFAQPVKPSLDGAFRFGGLRAGAYYLATAAEFDADLWRTDQFLRTVVPKAIRVDLKSGERKRQDIQLP